MTRPAVWILFVATIVSLQADGSSLFAQSAPAATNKNVSPSRAPTNQKAQAGDDKLNAAIAELVVKSERDPSNPEPHYARAYLEHKAGRVSEAQKSVVAARGLEKKRPIADWGRLMERYQGPSRAWLDDARRKPIEELTETEPTVPEKPAPKPVVTPSKPETAPTTPDAVSVKQKLTAAKPETTPDAPKESAPVLGFIGAINEQQQLVMVLTAPVPADEVITRDVAVNGKKFSVTEMKPITVIRRFPFPVPLQDVSISNLAGERLSEDQIREAVKGDTLVLMSPRPVDPRYLKLVKPDTLVVSRVIHVTAAAPADAGGKLPDAKRFPIEVPPVLVFATGLDDNGTLTTVAPVTEVVTRAISRSVISSTGEHFTIPEQLIEPAVTKFKSSQLRLRAAKFLTVKSATSSKVASKIPLDLAEARRRIDNGSSVFVAYGEIPDPRYLTMFRDDTLLIVASGKSMQATCASNDFCAAPAACAPAFPAPPPSVAELIAQLKNGDPNRRGNIPYQLGLMGPWAKAAVPVLVEGLKDKSINASQALAALKEIGPGASAAVPALTELMTSDAAASPARDGGAGLPPTFARPEMLRLLAADALCEIDPNAAKDAVPMLVQSVNSEDVGVRYFAAGVLARMASKESPQAIPVLLEQLKTDVAMSAVESFGRIDPANSKEIVAELLKLIKAPRQPQDAAIRVSAASLLAQLTQDNAEVVVPVLLESVTSTQFGISKIAATALLTVSPEFDSGREVLLNNLRPSLAPFACAPTSLGNKHDGDAGPAIALLHGNPADVAEARQLLLDKLHRSSPQDRYRTFSGWSDCRLPGKEVLLPILKQFEQDDDEIIQSAAKSAAAKIQATPPKPRRIPATVSAIRTRVIRPRAVIDAAAPAPAPNGTKGPPPPKAEPAPAPKA